MKRVVPAAVFCLMVASAHGNNAKLAFTGIVNTVTEGGPPAFPVVGDAVSGTIEYDLSSPDTDPVFDMGRYNQLVPGGFKVHVGSLLFSMDQFQMSVQNRVPGQGPFDALSINGDSPPLFGSFAQTHAGVGFQTPNNVLPSTAWPVDFDLSTIGQVDAAGVIMDTSPIPIWRIDFTLLTLKNVAVPEPSAMLLLALVHMRYSSGALSQADEIDFVKCARFRRSSARSTLKARA